MVLVLCEVYVVTPLSPPAGFNHVLFVTDQSDIRLVYKRVVHCYAFCLKSPAVHLHGLLDDASLLARSQIDAVMAAWNVSRFGNHVICQGLALALAHALGRHFRFGHLAGRVEGQRVDAEVFGHDLADSPCDELTLFLRKFDIPRRTFWNVEAAFEVELSHLSVVHLRLQLLIVLFELLFNFVWLKVVSKLEVIRVIELGRLDSANLWDYLFACVLGRLCELGFDWTSAGF